MNLADRAAGLFAKATNVFAPWHRWPFLIAIPTLAGIRANMRQDNLTDTETSPPHVDPAVRDIRGERTADGSYNSLDTPWMGMAGARFGRNFPLNETFAEPTERMLEPNPRKISNELLARGDFAAVPYLNLLVPSWLQFMVHDWMNHANRSIEDDPIKVPIASGDDWPERPMIVPRSIEAPTTSADEGRPSAYVNTETHWWDGSQIYGSSLERQLHVRRDPATGELRSDGKLGLTAKGLLPVVPVEEQTPDNEGAVFPGLELAGVNQNWWLGLSTMHTLFAREHNSVVDRLRIDYPDATGEWLFQKARLTVAALIAKIHTTEWTPALMNSPEGRFVMRSNWWGVTGEHYHRGYGRLDDSEEVSGIPGSPADQFGAPFSMTEEFTACYRMHPLMPDELSLRDHRDDHEIWLAGLLDLVHGKVSGVYEKVPFNDVIYSLATSHPGLLTLHNYPNSLRNLPARPGRAVDLAAIDILRDRERGVPRYCQFRRLLNMKAPRTFEELTSNTTWQAELKAVYKHVEDVDFLIGTLCEAPESLPRGFGFSDTVFRIFILMASRRLKSDRFFTDDFTPEIYTPAGYAWVQENSFRTVLQRHLPELAPLFADVRNVFFPWKAGAA